MEAAEYRKMAEVEDSMWFYRALHGYVERALERSVGAGIEGSRKGERVEDAKRKLAVLDAGCGTGGLIRRLSPRQPGWSWTGIDVEPSACALARERTHGAEIREGSITALPWKDQSFDAVVSADVIYHVDDDEGALREFFRVMRPGGSVVINVPAYRWLWSYHDVATHAKRRYDRSELVGKLQRAGFSEVRATHWNALPLPLVVARRKLLPPPATGSDVRQYPALVEAGFNFAMVLERGWLKAFGRLPWGSSLLAVARKPRD